MKHYILLIVILLLSACGGSGGGSTAAPEPEQTQGNTSNGGGAVEQSDDQDNEQSDDQADDQTADSDDNSEDASEQNTEQQYIAEMSSIEVEQNFDLSSAINLTFIVEQNTFSERVFVNVCVLNDSEQTLNYDECLLRTSLKQQGVSIDLQVPNSDVMVVAEVWYLSDPTNPQKHFWQFDASATEQVFNLQ